MKRVFVIRIKKGIWEYSGRPRRLRDGRSAFFPYFWPSFLHTQLKLSILTTTPARRTKKPQIENLNNAIIEGIRDKKGKNIIQLDLRKLREAPADFFIICEGDSNTHVNAISNSVFKKVKDELQTSPTHTEGSTNSTWVLMDYFDIVVHVFHPETRHFYELESLWSDAEVTEFGEV